MLRDLSLSSSPPVLSFCYDKSDMAQQSVKPGTSKNTAVDAQQEITSDPPAWFGDLLDKVGFFQFIFSARLPAYFVSNSDVFFAGFSSELKFYKMSRI